MRRFLITSDKFNGTAELHYNDGGVLIKIDCTQSDMNIETVTHFKRAVPGAIEILLDGKSFNAGTTIAEADLLATFEMFWDKYNKKINRKRASLLWHRLNKVDQVKAYYGIDGYLKFLKEEGWGRNRLDPENYLRNRTWETE